MRRRRIDGGAVQGDRFFVDRMVKPGTRPGFRVKMSPVLFVFERGRCLPVAGPFPNRRDAIRERDRLQRERGSSMAEDVKRTTETKEEPVTTSTTKTVEEPVDAGKSDAEDKADDSK